MRHLHTIDSPKFRAIPSLLSQMSLYQVSCDLMQPRIPRTVVHGLHALFLRFVEFEGPVCCSCFSRWTEIVGHSQGNDLLELCL